MSLYDDLYCFKKRQLKFIIAVGLLIWVIALLNPIIYINNGLKTSSLHDYSLCSMDFILSFDIVSILQDTNFTYMINPLFCASTLYIITINSSMVKAIRYNSKINLWNNNFFSIILLSFITTIFMILGTYIVGGILIGNFTNTWPGNNGFFYKLYGSTNIWTSLSKLFITPKILFIIFFSTFTYLSMLGTIINTLRIFLKQGYIFIAMVSMVFIDYVDLSTFSPLKSDIISLDNIINLNYSPNLF